MPQAVAKRTDADIQQDVIRELKADPRVEETEVGVEVDDGVVTLSGTVSSWGKRLAAEEAAHRVWGVLDVANDVVINPPGIGGPTDTEIAHAVREALEWNVFVAHERVTSTVSDGVVTLMGEVPTAQQREDVEKAVRHLSGVRGIVNRIEVRPGVVTPAEVKKSLEEALGRQAAREATRIDVAVRNGEVTLAGAVHSWAARQAVLGAAKGTPGVRLVRDQLRIEPYA
jgi:osmotically-inducible protein OsmY